MGADRHQQTLTLKVLWGSLLMSHLVFGYIGPTFLQNSGESGAENSHVIVGALVFFALVNAGMAIWFNIRSYKKEVWENGFEAGVGRFTSMSILSWAMGETISIFGLVSLVIGVESLVFYCFLGTGIGLHLYHRPQFDKIPN